MNDPNSHTGSQSGPSSDGQRTERDAWQIQVGDLVRGGRVQDAIAVLQDLASKDPSQTAVLKQLATLYWQMQRFEEAAEWLARLLEMEPGNGHLWNSRAMCLAAVGDDAGALSCFEHAVQILPDVEALQLNLAQAYAKTGQIGAALDGYRRALALNPKSELSLHAIADLGSKAGTPSEQLSALARLEEIRSLTVFEQILKSEALISMGDLDAAIAQIDRVLEAQPTDALATMIKGTALQQKGDHAKAVLEFEHAIQLDPDLAPAYWLLTQSKKFTSEDLPLVSMMERLVAREETPPQGRAIFNLAIGTAYNDLGEYEKAMTGMEEANRLFKALSTTTFDPVKFERYFDDIIETFTPEFLQAHRSLAIPSEMPLFIVGMPRSGTTLIESILSSRPKVTAGGEIEYWPTEGQLALKREARDIDERAALKSARRYLDLLRDKAPLAERVTDKLPFNFLHIGLLHLLFPRARFIHSRRHPVDTCISFFMCTFKNPPVYAHDRENIVFAYRQYARLMRHWREVIPQDRLLDMPYEDLVNEPEAHSRKLIEFCGLEWDDACLHPERNDRVISTMSHWQARQPVYKTSVERWRRYEPWLGAFRSLLDEPPTF